MAQIIYLYSPEEYRYNLLDETFFNWMSIFIERETLLKDYRNDTKKMFNTLDKYTKANIYEHYLSKLNRENRRLVNHEKYLAKKQKANNSEIRSHTSTAN